MSENSSDGPDRKQSSAFDVVLLHGKTADGEGASVLRMRPGRLEAGEVRPLKEGRPIQGGAQVVRLAPRQGTAHLYDVDVQYEAPPKSEANLAAEAGGPPQVATPAYRESWERTFGAQRRRRALSN